jgi:ketosteroid isomerase-like protein
MAEHPNATLIRRALDAMNAGDGETMMSVLADDVEWHEIGSAEAIHGRDALGERYAAGSDDYQITASLHDVVANDEHVVALAQAEADRDGKHLSYRTAEIFHVKDGRITARWSFSDDTAAINAFFA